MHVAREIARDNPGIIVFQASEEVAAEASADWSQPVQFRFEKAEDGTYELLLRTVSSTA